MLKPNVVRKDFYTEVCKHAHDAFAGADPISHTADLAHQIFKFVAGAMLIPTQDDHDARNFALLISSLCELPTERDFHATELAHHEKYVCRVFSKWAKGINRPPVFNYEEEHEKEDEEE